jgi:hypothetical protein
MKHITDPNMGSPLFEEWPFLILAYSEEKKMK